MGKYNFGVREVSNMEKNYREMLLSEIGNLKNEEVLRFLYIFVTDLSKSETEQSVSDLS